MKVIICGGRDFTDDALFKRKLAEFQAECGKITFVVHGDYRGADALARQWAKNSKIPQKPFPALWREFGPSAGPRRNQEMADFGADYCIAFPGGSGTADMLEKAGVAGIKTWSAAA